MKINVEIISKLNPCESRFTNFKKQYPNFDDSFTEFLKLENITYDDKVWVMVRLLSKNQLVHWSILCAESVLHIFENERPQDKRVSEALTTLKSIPDFENMSDAERKAANSAATNAANAANAATAATAAAYAANAATAAAYAANSAAAYAYAANSAANTAAAYAANAYAANSAYADLEEQRNLNLLMLVSVVGE